MKTVKETLSDKTLLRLVYTGKLFVGLAIVGGATKLRIEGETADGVWTRLHDEVGKTNPKYVGYAGARNRFLHFFPNGFNSDGYEANERGYELKPGRGSFSRCLSPKLSKVRVSAHKSSPSLERPTYCLLSK
jgi:hypothetical protein